MLRDIWSIILIAGLSGWLFSSVMLMFKAFPKKDAFESGIAVKWGLATVVSYFVWVLGLLNA